MINRANPTLRSSRFFALVLIVGLFMMTTLLFVHDSFTSEELNLKVFNVMTHKGLVSLHELNENVYKKFGYEIIRPTFPVPTLRMIKEPTCAVVFSEWQRISEQPQPEFPPGELPSDRIDEFLLYNYTAIDKWYINDKNSAKGEKPRSWNELSEMIKWPSTKLGGQQYGTEGVSMFNAMAARRLDGMSGVVIGSMHPWVEVSALVNGASKILTVEYNRLTIQEEFRDRMSSILPIDFVKNWQKYAGTFDFAASFSSIEHSGLGRYGDPIDPIGDIREILKIKCILKPGGILFLGFPLGTDAIQYNAHRIYGPVRLAMMFYGFEWLETFTGDSEEPMNLSSARLHSKGVFGQIQNTIVLRKL